jgi:hypothetical protein
LRERPVQALGRLMNFLGQRLKADRGEHQVMQDQLGRLRFAIDEQGDGLVQQGLGEGRIFLYARGQGLFEITGQCHVHFP